MDEFMFHMAYARLWKFINKPMLIFISKSHGKLHRKDPEHICRDYFGDCAWIEYDSMCLWPVMPAKNGSNYWKAWRAIAVIQTIDIIDLLMHDTWKKTFYD